MAGFRETCAGDPALWETCARHTARVTTRSLQYIYLCDNCAQRMTHEAFNGRPPLYHGETIDGFCGLCNTGCDVTLRQWFVCQICWNVVVAYQKSFVASEAVHDFWANHVADKGLGFTLRETEQVYLSPYARQARSKRIAAESLELLDFEVREAEQGPAVFHIELKSGPGSIGDMREFQLDVNDFNDIVGAVRHTGLPAYVFHVQLRVEYVPPTRRTLAVGGWWTDLVTLRAHFHSVRQRRGEDKRAAYFGPGAFRPWEEFPEQLAGRHFETLAATLKADPIDYLE